MLISSITACGKCVYCPRKPCIFIATNSGWVLGNRIDGTLAESLRIPYAETSLCPVPAGADEEAFVMVRNILPTGFE